MPSRTPLCKVSVTFSSSLSQFVQTIRLMYMPLSCQQGINARAVAMRRSRDGSRAPHRFPPSRAAEMPPRRASEQPTRAVKRARLAKLQEAEQQPATDAPGDLLRGLCFATEHGQRYVELASLVRKVSNKRGDKYLRALWRQLGQDEVAPQIEGVRKLQFAASRAQGSQKLAANLLGFQTVVREMEGEILDQNKELLASVARTLGGEVPLESRHRRVPLDDRTAVLVVMGDPPRMVLTMLVEAFGITRGWRYVESRLIPYFADCGVRMGRSSGDALQRARVADYDPQRRLNQHMA